MIFICIYNLPPIQVFREDTKSYYRYFGWSTLNGICPGYLRNGPVGQCTRVWHPKRPGYCAAPPVCFLASKLVDFEIAAEKLERERGEPSWPKLSRIVVPTPTVPVRFLPERSIAARLAPTPLKAAAVLTAAPVRIRYARVPWRPDIITASRIDNSLLTRSAQVVVCLVPPHSISLLTVCPA